MHWPAQQDIEIVFSLFLHNVAGDAAQTDAQRLFVLASTCLVGVSLSLTLGSVISTVTLHHKVESNICPKYSTRIQGDKVPPLRCEFGQFFQ